MTRHCIVSFTHMNLTGYNYCLGKFYKHIQQVLAFFLFILIKYLQITKCQISLKTSVYQMI